MKRATNGRQRRKWFLFAIATPAAVEVWACWVGLGSLCGFPAIGGRHGLSTDWTLAVGQEAYGVYALNVWLGAAPGPRSRKFAQWSALGSFTLSLIGQVTYHLMLAGRVTKAPTIVIVFVACLVVLVIGAAAILTHLMHADERAAADTAEEAALQAALARERSARLLAEAERDTARREAADTAAKAEATLAAGERHKPDTADTAAPRPPRRKSDTAASKPAVPKDVDKQAEALAILAAEPDISGSELGRRIGVQASYGRRLKTRLTQTAPGGGR